jgi:hypothetical protein
MKAEDSEKSDPSVIYTLIFKVKVHDERNDHMPLQLMQQPLPIAWSVGINMYKQNNDATEAQYTLSLSHKCLCHKTMSIINFLKPLRRSLITVY